MTDTAAVLPLISALDWREVLGPDTKLVTGLGHIPQFSVENGCARPITKTLARF